MREHHPAGIPQFASHEFSLVGLLVFEQIGLRIALGVVLGPLVAMMLKKLPLE